MSDSRPPATLISSVMRLMPERRTSQTMRSDDPGVDLNVTHGPSSSTVPSSIAPPRTGEHTRDHYRAVAAAVLMVGLIALSATVRSTAESGPEAQPQNEWSRDNERGMSPSVAPSEPTVTVLDHRDVQGILGKEVRSAADENMGRIVDVIVDRTGHVRAAVVDFGGFLGVGSRRIAIAWNALRFPANGNKVERVTLEWTRDQVREAPEYRDDKPVVMLEAASNLELPPFP
jgi:PRC-barrel domain